MLCNILPLKMWIDWGSGKMSSSISGQGMNVLIIIP